MSAQAASPVRAAWAREGARTELALVAVTSGKGLALDLVPAVMARVQAAAQVQAAQAAQVVQVRVVPAAPEPVPQARAH